MPVAKTNLVLQSFGRETEYRRAVLTILSFFAHSSVPLKDSNVLLFTDQPDFFKPYLAGLPIEFVLLTPEKIKSMRGKIDFLHRMKIALIEEAFVKTEGSILYADSDTFFTADPAPLMNQLSVDCSFMHVWEYQFERMRNLPLPAGETARAFLSLIETNSFWLANQETLKITPQHSSWNAGVMMLHRSHKAFIPDVYALTDQFYPSTQNHASEQYAFSIVLQKNTELRACDQVIYHYWYRVKKEIIDRFLLSMINPEWANRSLDERITAIKHYTYSLPSLLERHVLMLKDNSIQALNENQFSKGYVWALKAFKKGAYSDKKFIKDVLYHLKRQLTKK